MRQKVSTSTVVMWTLAIITAISACRYFIASNATLLSAQLAVLSRNPAWLRVHVACGIVAITTGLFQFLPSLRAARPRLHRAFGYAYLLAVLLGSIAGLRLAPDTPRFAAEGANDHRAFALLGAPAEAALYAPSVFAIVEPGFALLALSWLITSGMALLRARQRRFDVHRTWMMRSYSLTFAAATVRLSAIPLYIVTRNPALSITLALWSWPLNLAAVELIRSRPAAVRAEGAVAG